MEHLKRLWDEVVNLEGEASLAPPSDYRQGYLNALQDVGELIEEHLWEAGEAI